MNNRQSDVQYQILEKPDWVSYEDVVKVLHSAHQSTIKKGMHFVAAHQNAEEIIRRLGKQGKFFIALSDTNDVIGVGAVSLHDKCNGWYGKNKPYAEIKMVGVREGYKGNGISSALYEAMEQYGFSKCDLMVMNTARENHIVLDSNARHGWKYVDFKSWSKTDYYSPVMAKWKQECPYSDNYIQIRYAFRKLHTYILRKKKGQYRFPFNMIKHSN